MAEGVRPETVVVLGKRHAIQWDVELGRDCGDIHFTRNEVRIAKDLAPDEERETLQHELIHGLDYAIGIGLSEAKTRALSAAWFALIAANPGLAEYLYGSRE